MGFRKDWTLSDMEDDFRQAMIDAGVAPASGVKLSLDGRKHKCKIHDDKGSQKSLDYCFYLNNYPDKRPAGWFHCWKAAHGDIYRTWIMGGEIEPMTDEEKAKYIADIKEQQAAAERKKRAEEDRAITKARLLWDTATPINPEIFNTPYLKDKKKLKVAPAARQYDKSCLILPIQNEHGDIMTVQKIFCRDGRYQTRPGYWEDKKVGDKWFQPGAPMRGNFILLAEPNAAASPRPTPPEAEAKPKQGVEADSASDGAEPQSLESLLAPPEIEQCGQGRQSRQRMWICEGWATGVSVWEATGERVVVALNAGNLLPVGRKIRKLWPHLELVGAPDWDRKHGNRGMSAMIELMDELGIAVVPPKFKENEDGSDWNDYYFLHGLKATRKALAEGLAAAYAIPNFDRRRRENLFPHTKADGGPKKTVANLTALLGYLNVTVKYNMITKRIEFGIPMASFSVDNEQNAADGYITSKCVEYGLPETTWKSFAWTVCDRGAYNPAKDWILSKPWDGTPRLPELLDTIATPPSYPNDMKETLIEKWLLSAVAAVFCDDNFRCRGVLTFQGQQSTGKTSWFKWLIPKQYQGSWFGEGLALNVDNKDSVKLAVSKWITELGELESTFKRSDLSKLKGFVTLSRDEMRLPYAISESSFPRRTVFAATVNDKNFLIDDTGNTRWWVIETLHIDYQHQINTQQLFAEIYENNFLRGDMWVLTKDEERRLEEQNNEYRIVSAAEDLVSRKLEWHESKNFWTWRTVTEVLIECGIDKPQKADIVRATRVIKEMTGQESSRKGHSGARVYLLPTVNKRPDGEKGIDGDR